MRFTVNMTYDISLYNATYLRSPGALCVTIFWLKICRVYLCVWTVSTHSVPMIYEPTLDSGNFEPHQHPMNIFFEWYLSTARSFNDLLSYNQFVKINRNYFSLTECQKIANGMKKTPKNNTNVRFV